MKTIADLAAWLEAAPPGTLLPASEVANQVRQLSPSAPAAVAPPDIAPSSWRERLWTAPGEVRIGVVEVAEALGRPTSWVYRHTSTKAAKAAGYVLLPHRKLEGELTFVVGEIRAWVRDNEDVFRTGRMEPATTPAKLELAA